MKERLALILSMLAKRRVCSNAQAIQMLGQIGSSQSPCASSLLLIFFLQNCRGEDSKEKNRLLASRQHPQVIETLVPPKTFLNPTDEGNRDGILSFRLFKKFWRVEQRRCKMSLYSVDINVPAKIVSQLVSQLWPSCSSCRCSLRSPLITCVSSLHTFRLVFFSF